jgi:hypothetical protein
MQQDAVTLFRPTGERELDRIRETGWRAFPPRLSDQPFFYPAEDLDDFNGHLVGIIEVVAVYRSGSDK